MSSIPHYSGEENLRRIKMQKSTKFIVVEGVDDVPIYESCISSAVSNACKYDVIFADGKIPIRQYVSSNQSENAIFLIDRDFMDMEVVDGRIISLQRYSIENYFICEEVICYLLQFALNCKYKDLEDLVKIDDFIESLEKSLSDLVKVIFFYQKIVSPSLSGQARPSWSDTFLCQNDSWNLCDVKINELIVKLLPEPYGIEDARKYFGDNFSLGNKIVEIFPGKMLKHSLHRYIKNYAKSLKPKAGAKFSDVENTKMLLTAVLHKSSKLKDILVPVFDFLKPQMT